jgi:hypothetical protein
MSGKNFIAKATENEGGLHKALGYAMGKKIPKEAVAKAAARGGKVGKEAKLAETLSKLRPNK